MDQEFYSRLLATFKIEAEEHLKTISTGLITFEKCEDLIKKNSIIEPVYRAAHSLKGAARAVELIEIERLCQNIEHVFSALKKLELKETFQLFDNLHKGVDLITSYLVSKNEDQKSEIKNNMEDLINILNEHLVVDYQEPPQANDFKNYNYIDNKVIPRIPDDKNKQDELTTNNKIEEQNKNNNNVLLPNPTNEEEKIPSQDIKPVTETIPSAGTVRISTSKLDSLLYQGEEMLSSKLASEELTRNISHLEIYLDIWKRELEKINTHIRNLKTISLSNSDNESGIEVDNKMIGNFLNWNQSFIGQLNEEIRFLSKYSQNNSYTLGRMIDHLVDDMKEILLLPFSHLLDFFPKLVRDLSRDMGKEVDLEITGADTMIDRRILEEMKDPLIHLVRNCIDHGIEIESQRIGQNKNAKGKIAIVIKPVEGNKILIEISDDGKGIDLEKIKLTAVAQGLVSENRISALTNSEITSFIFESGISTSKAITDISGRGLGMAIVKEHVEKLGGSIKIETGREKGTSFKIFLPLTLTTFRGIVLKCSGRLFVIQTVNVKNVMRILSKSIKTIENKETIIIDDKPVSLVFLSDILGLPREKNFEDAHFMTVIILTSATNNIAFVVDEILNEQEILLKQFNYQLVKIKNIAGATILGGGQVVPLLNVNDLLKSAELPSKRKIKIATPELKKDRILVVDDSITSRTLLKDILESGGYRVKLAVDGIDALTTLKGNTFDLVVSDIEMPRMNGFDLTSAIKNDKKISSIPVVLVTALAKKEDRERGMDVGANAYIVKSSFDQSDLLSIIKRLI